MSNKNLKKADPHTFGFEWAHELEGDILSHLNEQSCVELIPENFVGGRFDSFLNSLEASGVPVAIHGVELSIAAMEPLDQKHLESVLEIAKQVNTVHFSEHLSLTAVNNISLDALTPVAW